jgi:ribonucleotide monophosphatase NagD (HAD superfamily)
MTTEENNKTIFCDIDGVLLNYDLEEFSFSSKEATTGTREKLLEWHSKGYKIILVTGRPEAARKITEENLLKCNLLFDSLVMGIGSGVRILINDIDPKHPTVNKAVAINLTRNKGIGNVNI